MKYDINHIVSENGSIVSDTRTSFHFPGGDVDDKESAEDHNGQREQPLVDVRDSLVYKTGYSCNIRKASFSMMPTASMASPIAMVPLSGIIGLLTWTLTGTEW